MATSKNILKAQQSAYTAAKTSNKSNTSSSGSIPNVGVVALPTITSGGIKKSTKTTASQKASMTAKPTAKTTAKSKRTTGATTVPNVGVVALPTVKSGATAKASTKLGARRKSMKRKSGMTNKYNMM